LEFNDFFIIRVIIFTLGSLFLIKLSWKSLRNTSSHGFYRFFAFEGILALVLMNIPFWTKNPFSSLQLISWFLLFFSILFVSQGLHLLRKKGGSIENRGAQPENLSFENTTDLVTEGVFKYIRHPMYSSLILLAWGAFFKFITIFGFFIAIIVTVFLIATAKLEEKENILFFGVSYEDYMKTTKIFFPYLL